MGFPLVCHLVAGQFLNLFTLLRCIQKLNNLADILSCRAISLPSTAQIIFLYDCTSPSQKKKILQLSPIVWAHLYVISGGRKQGALLYMYYTLKWHINIKLVTDQNYLELYCIHKLVIKAYLGILYLEYCIWEAMV